MVAALERFHWCDVINLALHAEHSTRHQASCKCRSAAHLHDSRDGKLLLVAVCGINRCTATHLHANRPMAHHPYRHPSLPTAVRDAALVISAHWPIRDIAHIAPAAFICLHSCSLTGCRGTGPIIACQSVEQIAQLHIIIICCCDCLFILSHFGLLTSRIATRFVIRSGPVLCAHW